MRQEVNAKV